MSYTLEAFVECLPRVLMTLKPFWAVYYSTLVHSGMGEYFQLKVKDKTRTLSRGTTQ